ncbi:MAG: hypothetical protein IKT67_06835 [Lachnospiraceae bacterium]|nr:hypothetical protein [Lachnospiraceae bacterium]
MNKLIEEANALLQGQGFSYGICGGFALDLFLGYETRTHGDIDILAFWEDREEIITYMQSKGFLIYEMLGGGKVHRITDIRMQEKLRKNIFCCTEDCELVRLYDTEEPDVYWLDFQHIGLSKLNYIEFLFNEKTEDEFVYIRDNRVRRKLEKVILEKDGIPYLAPELCLLFKSSDIEREGYQQDFELTVDRLNGEQRAWFEKAMEMLYPEGHKWKE